MRQFVKLAISALLIALPFPGNAQGLSHPSKYSNCKTMQSAYPLGIAKNRASAGLYKAKISASLYMRYEKFDFDFDGIVCEKELVQASLTTATTTTTTTLVGMAGGSVAPAGIWRDDWFFGKQEFVIGTGYRIFLCASGSISPIIKTLEIQVSGQWLKKAVSVPSTASQLCDATYPILYSFYWIADVSGPESKTFIDARITGFPGQIVTAVRTIVKFSSPTTSMAPQLSPTTSMAPLPTFSNTTTTTSPMPTLSFSEERFKGGSCSLISANLDMSSAFQCPGLSSLKLYGQPQKSFSFPAIFKRQYQWNGTNVTCSWNIGSALYFCS